MKKFYKAFFAVCVYVCAANFASCQEYEINTSLDQAKTYIKNEQFTQAISFLQDFIKTNPNNSDAYYTLGEAYRATDNRDKALECFEKAYTLTNAAQKNTDKTISAATFESAVASSDNADYATDYIDMGDMYAKQKAYDSAIYYYENALSLQPENESLIAKLADTYYQVKDFTKSDFYQAKLNKKESEITYDARYYNKKGISYYQVGDLDRAKEYFAKSIALDAKYFEAYNNLANTELKLGNDKEALKLYQKALQLDKKYTDAMLNIAGVYKTDSSLQLKYINKAIKVDSENYRAYFERGLVYYNQKQKDSALKDFLMAVNLDPEYFEANYNIAMIYAGKGELQEAAKFLQSALKSNADSSLANYFMAKIYLAMDRADLAIEYLDTASKNDPQNQKYYLDLSKIYFKQNNYEKAFDEAQKACSIGKSGDSYNLLGLILYKQKNYDQAIENFSKAIEIDSKRPIFHYNLAQCYKTIGNKLSSQREFQASVAIQPESWESYIDLANIYQDRQLYLYAQNTLEKALEAYPGNKTFYSMLSQSYKSSGDFQSAEELLKKYKIDVSN